MTANLPQLDLPQPGSHGSWESFADAVVRALLVYEEQVRAYLKEPGLIDIETGTTGALSVVRSAGGRLRFADAFGAKYDNSVDDAAKIADQLAAGIKGPLIPDSVVARFKSKLTLGSIDQSLRGDARNSYIFKGYNGDLIQLDGTNTVLDGLNIEGQGGTFTGRGIVIASGNRQRIVNCRISDTASYAIEVTAADAATTMSIAHCELSSHTASTPAIKFPTDTLTGGLRRIFDVATGGTVLADISGANQTWIQFCDTAGITMGANTRLAKIVLNRLAFAPDIYGASNTIGLNSVGAAVTVKSGAAGTVLLGNHIASDVTLEAGSTGTCLWGNVVSGTFTDSSNANAGNFIHGIVSSTAPTFKATTSDPSVGAGSITGRCERNGQTITAHVKITLGAGFSAGTGDWYVILPAPFNKTATHDCSCIVSGLSTGVAYKTSMVAVMAAGDNRIFFRMPTGNQYPTLDGGWTPASGNFYQFSLNIPTG